MTPAFTLHGTAYGYLTPDPGNMDAIHAWEDGKLPKVVATLALLGGGTLDVYARAEQWNMSYVLVSWEDDQRNPHHAWIPAGSVRRVPDAEWGVRESAPDPTSSGTG